MSATARGVTDAGRTTAGTDIVDGTKFIIVVLLSSFMMKEGRSEKPNRAHD